MASPVNFTKYFKEAQEVYVQNLSSCQVSCSFEVGPGRSEGFLFPPSKDPVILSNHIPKAACESSIDLRKMLSRQPQTLKLLTEQEFNAYYQGMATRSGLDSTEEAIEHAERKRMAAQNHTVLPDAVDPVKIHEVVEDGQRLGEKKTVKSNDVASVEEEVNSRILHLCLQVHASLDEQQRMSAQSFLSELDSLDNLNAQDWAYVQSFGYYKSVKQLAKKRLAELAASEPDDELVVPVPAKKTSKKTAKMA